MFSIDLIIMHAALASIYIYSECRLVRPVDRAIVTAHVHVHHSQSSVSAFQPNSSGSTPSLNIIVP